MKPISGWWSILRPLLYVENEIPERSPELLQAWLSSERHAFSTNNVLYFGQLLLWFSWPALPLAVWSLWHFRSHLLQRPQFQLTLVFFAVALLLLAVSLSAGAT